MTMNDTINLEGIPDDYRYPAVHQGRIERFVYEAETREEAGSGRLNKTCYVYLPNGYSGKAPSEKYDIVYFMHWGGGKASQVFGINGNYTELKHIVDHMVENRDIRPVIIAAPTFYDTAGSSNNETREGVRLLADRFPEELANYLMPLLEEKYSINASREHRCFAGFSMGAVVTWNVFTSCLDKFSMFMPLSGESWHLGAHEGGPRAAETALLLADAVRSGGYKDFSIYCATGTGDMAFPTMTNQIRAMLEYGDVFRAEEGGNLRFVVQNGGIHTVGYAFYYFYNGLKYMFG